MESVSKAEEREAENILTLKLDEVRADQEEVERRKRAIIKASKTQFV